MITSTVFNICIFNFRYMTSQLGCHDRVPQTGGLNSRNVFLLVLEAGRNLISRCQSESQSGGQDSNVWTWGIHRHSVHNWVFFFPEISLGLTFFYISWRWYIPETTHSWALRKHSQALSKLCSMCYLLSKNKTFLQGASKSRPTCAGRSVLILPAILCAPKSFLRSLSEMISVRIWPIGGAGARWRAGGRAVFPCSLPASVPGSGRVSVPTRSHLLPGEHLLPDSKLTVRSFPQAQGL